MYVSNKDRKEKLKSSLSLNRPEYLTDVHTHHNHWTGTQLTLAGAKNNNNECLSKGRTENWTCPSPSPTREFTFLSLVLMNQTSEPHEAADLLELHVLGEKLKGWIEWSWQTACASSPPSSSCPLCPARCRPPLSGSSSWTYLRWIPGKAREPRERERERERLLSTHQHPERPLRYNYTCLHAKHFCY